MHGVASQDRHFVIGCIAIRKPAKKVFDPKAIVQTGRSQRPIGRQSFDCGSSAKARRIENELRLYEQRELSLVTIHRCCVRHMQSH